MFFYKPIEEDCTWGVDCPELSPYGYSTSQNAIRQLYIEKRAGDFIYKNRNNYDIAFFITADYYFLSPLEKQGILSMLANVIPSQRLVRSSFIRDFRGYTNGFYFGNPNSLATILKRYDYMDNQIKDVASYLKKEPAVRYNYEYQLKHSFYLKDIYRVKDKIMFCKTRATKYCDLQLSGPVVLHDFSKSEMKQICKSYLYLRKEGISPVKVPKFYVEMCKSVLTESIL